MLRQFLLGFALAGGISAQACAETVTILMEGVPDTEYVKTLVPEFTKETGIQVRVHSGEPPELASQIIQEGAELVQGKQVLAVDASLELSLTQPIQTDRREACK